MAKITEHFRWLASSYSQWLSLSPYELAIFTVSTVLVRYDTVG